MVPSHFVHSIINPLILPEGRPVDSTLSWLLMHWPKRKSLSSPLFSHSNTFFSFSVTFIKARIDKCVLLCTRAMMIDDSCPSQRESPQGSHFSLLYSPSHYPNHPLSNGLECRIQDSINWLGASPQEQVLMIMHFHSMRELFSLDPRREGLCSCIC